MKHDNFFFVYDFETTGYDAVLQQAAELGFLIKDIDMNEVERFCSYIQPLAGREIKQSALDFNKITVEQMKSGITYKDLYLKLVSIFKKYNRGQKKITLVGHNSDKFDIQFLEDIFKTHNDDIYKHVAESTIDTMAFSRLKWGNVEVNDHKLSSVAERCGVELTNAHNAMPDVEATAGILEYMINCLRNVNQVSNSVLENKKEIIQFQF